MKRRKGGPTFQVGSYETGNEAEGWNGLWTALRDSEKLAYLVARSRIHESLQEIERRLRGCRKPRFGPRHAGYGGFRMLNAQVAQQLGDYLMGYIAAQAPAHGVGFDVRVLDRYVGFRIYLLEEGRTP